MSKYLAIILFLALIFGVSCNLEEKDMIYVKYSYQEVSKSRQLYIKDIEIFKGSEIWELAKSVYEQDTLKIRTIVAGKPEYLNKRDTAMGFTLLHWAIYNGRYYSAKTLLELGADPNVMSNHNLWPLVLAAQKDNTSIYVDLLLKYNADVNQVAKEVRYGTALQAAAENNLKNVKILIKAGAKAYDTLNNPMSSACVGRKIETIQYLIQCGADFHAPIAIIADKPIYPYAFIMEMPFRKNSKEYKIKHDVLSYIKLHGGDTTHLPPIAEHR